MKNKSLRIVLSLLALNTLVILFAGCEAAPNQNQSFAEPSPSSLTETRNSPRVPDYQSASEARNLPPTLPASQFFGKAREAYIVAKEIPQTLAQLPCYCHCDQLFGHKSLHTCFVDDHASHCAVCVDEALLAFRLQREEKLTPDQVRERIIEKYGTEHHH